ncbi:MAG: tetratricopeptide repeat protein [Nevskia sp.]|nr:tetratricopeptide repeat protein [Nevskia sp.]
MQRFPRALAAAALATSCAALASGYADFRAGVAAEDKGDYDGAIRLIGRALRGGLNDETQEAAYYNRGVAYHRKGRYDEAIADYSAALKLKPTDAQAHNNRGVAYKNKRQYELALADYDEAIKLEPDNASAHFNRANAYVHQGQDERAIADFNAAIRLKPDGAARPPSYFDEAQFKPAGAGAATSAGRQNARSESAQYVLIWRYLAERRDGGDGRGELANAASRLRSRGWPYPVIAFFLGKLGRNDLLAAAQGANADAPPTQRCEASAYLGEDDLLRGNTDSALHLFKQALDSCEAGSAEHALVVAEQDRITQRR